MNGYVAAIAVLISVAGTDGPTEADRAASPPALVSDASPSIADSPVVQAAKRAAARRKSAVAPMAVITDATLTKSGGRLSTSSGGAAISAHGASTRVRDPRQPVRIAATRARPVIALEGYAAHAAGSFCLSQLSQNTSGGTPAQHGTMPAPLAASPAPPPQNAYAAPRAATNASSGPQESQNAGPNRLNRP